MMLRIGCDDARGGFTWRRVVRCGAIIALIATIAGCSAEKDPAEATISWLAPQTRAAKPTDCAMPLLSEMPNAEYQQIAIVEVSDDFDADPQEAIDLARRKACETGADALVIRENQQQKRGKALPGYSAEESSLAGPETGANVRAREHLPEIGEVGHKARFLNGVAIIYKTPQS